ncbi:4'-phosphopantetheinyl transferase superfamily protein [Microvirga sp. 2MCAF38]|uniref:4'-phosphopantetheinyl transferase family protein n=1 Tax=Microvirga sp. 2MCAF38 TaxID=3232989 RepID=UPI003F9708CE
MISFRQIDHSRTSLVSTCLGVFLEAASSDERQHIARLRRERDRLSYRVSHGGLRLAIAQDTGLAPSDVKFTRTSSGKPICLDGPYFSMSYSAGVTAIAVSASVELGLDIEALPSEELPAGSLSSAVAHEEKGLLARLSESQGRAETMLWSIKEAALKLTGDVMIDPRHLAVRQLRGGGFKVEPSRAASAPFPPIFVRRVETGLDRVAFLATYKILSASDVVARSANPPEMPRRAFSADPTTSSHSLVGLKTFQPELRDLLP